MSALTTGLTSSLQRAVGLYVKPNIQEFRFPKIVLFPMSQLRNLRTPYLIIFFPKLSKRVSVLVFPFHKIPGLCQIRTLRSSGSRTGHWRMHSYLIFLECVVMIMYQITSPIAKSLIMKDPAPEQQTSLRA